jgi:GTP-binding protein Era
MGVVNTPEAQLVFVDAPGVVQAKSGLNMFLREEAEDVMSESDVLVAVLNIDEKRAENLEEIIGLVKGSGKPWVALIHKTDLPQLHRPQILREKLQAMGVPVVQGSALSEPKALAETILDRLIPFLPSADQPLYDTELYTLSTTRDLCGEIVREKCFENLHQEIPFGLAVKIEKFVEDDGPVVKIYSEIMVAKENHRAIVVGRSGGVLKKIGTEARKEMELLTGRRVFLDLKVTSKRNWQKNPGIMKELGYVLPTA